MRESEYFRANQPVVDDDFGLAQQFGRAQREEIRMAGTGADKVDGAGRRWPRPRTEGFDCAERQTPERRAGRSDIATRGRSRCRLGWACPRVFRAPHECSVIGRAMGVHGAPRVPIRCACEFWVVRCGKSLRSIKE